MLFSTIAILGQEADYPQNYFQKPLDIPIILSGTFGELRSNHFHSGIDVKTQQREGLKVFATAEGYVSRIKISHWGYGKAVYITHPNGYTTVYGHLKKFDKKIETYLKKKQYEKESFSIQLFPGAHELPVSKGEARKNPLRNKLASKTRSPSCMYMLRISSTRQPIASSVAMIAPVDVPAMRSK